MDVSTIIDYRENSDKEHEAKLSELGIRDRTVPNSLATAVMIVTIENLADRLLKDAWQKVVSQQRKNVQETPSSLGCR